MTDDDLKEIIKRKDDRIEDLERKNKLLYNLLYQSKQELSRLKDRVEEQLDDPETILHHDQDEGNT